MTDPRAARGGSRVRRRCGLALAALLTAYPPEAPAAAARVSAMVPNVAPDASPDAPPRGPQRGAEPYAVVVHPSSAVSDVPLKQLRRIFLGEQQFWPGGGRVVLFVQAPGVAEREVALRRAVPDGRVVVQALLDRARRSATRSTSGPKLVSTSALARRLTATIPGAVAVIPLARWTRA